MSEIVNLRQARKRAARAVHEEEAATNRAKFGQTKAAHAVAKNAAQRLRTALDGAKREDEPK